MKKPVLFFCFLLITILAFSQSDSASYFLQLAQKEKDAGHRMQTLRNLEKAYGYDSSNRDIVGQLADSYLELRRYPQAKEKYKKLVSMGDESPATLKQVVTLSFNLRQYPDVFEYAGRLKKVDQAEPVNYYIGKAHYDQDNYGEAIKYLEQAMQEQPDNGEIPYLIGRAYSDMMNYKTSVGYFEKAISLSPDKNNWYYELGLIYYAMHDDKNSLKYILEAGEKGYPKSNDYLENLGIAYLNIGNLDEGIKIMKQILDMRPSDLNVLNMIAEAYYYAKKYNEAMAHWDKILEYDKQNAAALYMIGMCYQKKGEKGKGIALCDKAIEMDPSLSYLKQKKEMMGL